MLKVPALYDHIITVVRNSYLLSKYIIYLDSYVLFYIYVTELGNPFKIRSLKDVPLIYSCPEDHASDWQLRILLGMVKARSVNKAAVDTIFKEKYEPI